MQKTKLGISVGLLGALLYFSGLFGGYVITIIMAGYVLLAEENMWLRKASVKAVALMVVFSILPSLLSLIPGAIEIINEICALFESYFTVPYISNIINLLQNVIYFVEKLVFLGLGLKALTQGTIQIPVVDDMVNKHMQ